jgi:hypothetical protein
MSEKWIDWHPKVGDVRPDVYRWKHKSRQQWRDGNNQDPMDEYDISCNDYQIPDPKETSMKYWQPRIEPLSKGWTLADVPSGVVCKVHTRSGDMFAHRNHNDEVICNLKHMHAFDPSESRVIRVIDPIPAGAMTLDKVPNDVKCVVTDGDQQFIRYRQGSVAKGIGSSEPEITSPKLLTVLHILDPLPEVTYTLDTLPVWRVIEWQRNRYFKHGIGEPNGPFSYWNQKGQIVNGVSGPNDGGFTVTDYIMELKEVV